VQNDFLYSDDFGGSIEGNGNAGGIGGGNANGSDGLNAGGGDSTGGNSGTGNFGSPGGAVVDLGANSPSSGSTMEFSASDAKALGVAALQLAGGVVAISKGSVAAGVLSVSATSLNSASAVGTAISHAAHDIGVSQANSPISDPNNVGLFESTSEQSTIDAINSDGGFGNLYPIVDGQVIDQSVGGNVLATDQVAGGHSLYWDNFYQVNPYAHVQF
jgi:hypothetical protein